MHAGKVGPTPGISVGVGVGVGVRVRVMVTVRVRVSSGEVGTIPGLEQTTTTTYTPDPNPKLFRPMEADLNADGKLSKEEWVAKNGNDALFNACVRGPDQGWN